MPEENVKIVQAAQQRFASGDFSWIATDDDFELVTPRENPDGGTYRGEAARRWLMAWHSSFEEVTIESTETIDSGDQVFSGIL